MSCPTSRRSNANQHYLPYIYICTCAGAKQLDVHKTCAVTLTGKRPPNRDPELQRTELVQDTKALMVQDTRALMVQDTKASMVQDTKTSQVQNTKTSLVQDTKALLVQDTKTSLVQDTKALLVQDTKALLVQDTKHVCRSLSCTASWRCVAQRPSWLVPEVIIRRDTMQANDSFQRRVLQCCSFGVINA